jgi:branched-chain amino acid transport system ATP-binding protein
MGGIASGRTLAARVNEVFSSLPGLGKCMEQKAGTMSGDEQQMLAIGRGLMTYPGLMLFDEPPDGIMPMLVN